jgi:hypothetical protein
MRSSSERMFAPSSLAVFEKRGEFSSQ